jgi:hypothetical protein
MLSVSEIESVHEISKCIFDNPVEGMISDRIRQELAHIGVIMHHKLWDERRRVGDLIKRLNTDEPGQTIYRASCGAVTIIGLFTALFGSDIVGLFIAIGGACILIIGEFNNFAVSYNKDIESKPLLLAIEREENLLAELKARGEDYVQN